MKTITVAAIQLSATLDKPANVARAAALVDAAAQRGATLVVLPELFNCLGRLEQVVEQAEPIPGPTSTAMSALAARLGITLVAGSLCERSDDSAHAAKAYNTALVFGPDGAMLGRYRKLHLFDVDVPDQVSYRESQWILPGDAPLLVQADAAQQAEAPVASALGVAICYDLRFPELFRTLAARGMDVLAVPSAFAAATGREHWHVLLRARAIENQAYVIAANQVGQHTPKFATFGHSLIADPWGRVLAELPDGEGVIVAELSGAHLAQVRRNLPALDHRRL